MQTPDKAFGLKRWVWVTFLGWLLGVLLILALSSLLDSMGIEDMQFYLGIGMAGGVSFTQWLRLRKFAPISQAWIWSAVLGMGIPFIVLDLLPDEMIPHKLALSIGIGSLLVGFLQARILKKHFSKTGSWILVSFLGWVLAVATVFTIDHTHHLQGIIPNNVLLALINLLLILAGGIVLGAITGIALRRVFRRQIS